jgi:hypothetical protein
MDAYSLGLLIWQVHLDGKSPANVSMKVWMPEYILIQFLTEIVTLQDCKSWPDWAFHEVIKESFQRGLGSNTIDKMLQAILHLCCREPDQRSIANAMSALQTGTTDTTDQGAASSYHPSESIYDRIGGLFSSQLSLSSYARIPLIFLQTLLQSPKETWQIHYFVRAAFPISPVTY